MQRKPKGIFQFLTKELEGKIEFELSKNSHYENREYKEGFIFCITHNFSIESGISLLNELYKGHPSPDRFLANIEKLSIEEILKMSQRIIDSQYNENPTTIKQCKTRMKYSSKKQKRK